MGRMDDSMMRGLLKTLESNLESLKKRADQGPSHSLEGKALFEWVQGHLGAESRGEIQVGDLVQPRVESTYRRDMRYIVVKAWDDVQYKVCEPNEKREVLVYDCILCHVSMQGEEHDHAVPMFYTMLRSNLERLPL